MKISNTTPLVHSNVPCTKRDAWNRVNSLAETALDNPKFAPVLAWWVDHALRGGCQ